MSLEQLMSKVMEANPLLPEPDAALAVAELGDADREEVLSFLAERPVHTVCMAGFVRDNGLVSEHNRGTFYGCRNSRGRLEGVALVGHHTLVEARTRGAMRELALAAQAHTRLHMIMGELEAVEEFWGHYSDEGQEMRRACRELLFELRRPVEARHGGAEPRPATPDDLDLIAPVHAALAEAESGINPLERDPEGFRRRCLRRIVQGRTWVVIEGGVLLFKADVQADTPDVVYLEGVYLSPALRGTGEARGHMAWLCRRLLAGTRRVCLLANEENVRAHGFYRGCGFKLRGVYDTIFLGGPARRG